MRKSIMIDHAHEKNKNTFIVNWFLGNACNYKCSYCTADLNSGNKKWIPSNIIIKFVEKASNTIKANSPKNIVFEFTGGEVTLFKDLPVILSVIRKHEGETAIISNGSRDINYWRELKNNLNYCDLSFHADFCNEEHFLNVIELLSDKVYVFASIMMNPNYFDRCIKIGKKIVNMYPHVCLGYHPIMKNLTNDHRLVEYTQEQLAIIKELELETQERTKKLGRNFYRGIMVNYYSDGTKINYLPEQYTAQKINNWKGWFCWAGLEQIVITAEGDVFRAWCAQDCLGNIYKDNVNFPTEPTICKKDLCHCNLDIMTKKQNRLC